MPEKIVEFVIDGDPEAWKRAGYYQHSKGLTIYDPQGKEKRETKKQLARQFSEKPLEGPLRVELVFEMAIPQTRRSAILSKDIKYSKKPDVDNLQKYIFDCMNGLIIHDDAQIYEVHAKKVYSEKPCTIIRLFEWIEEDESI